MEGVRELAEPGGVEGGGEREKIWVLCNYQRCLPLTAALSDSIVFRDTFNLA